MSVVDANPTSSTPSRGQILFYLDVFKIHLDYLDFCLINTIAFDNNILSVDYKKQQNLIHAWFRTLLFQFDELEIGSMT